MKLAKDSIDLGIVTRDAAASVAFYRDVLGMEDLGTNPIPWGTLHRLVCGASAIKIVSVDGGPPADAAPGGLPAATGYRYWTISVTNLSGVVAACEAAGRPIAVPPTEIRTGVTIAMVEDPDGNWVELLQTG